MVGQHSRLPLAQSRVPCVGLRAPCDQLLVAGGPLDAPGLMPAGSMLAFTGAGVLLLESTISRGCRGF